MARKYAIRNNSEVHFVTFTVVNWIDLFIRHEYNEIFLNSLRFCQENKGLNVHAYCIMTSHIHLMLSVINDNDLSDVIRDMKSFTSGKIVEEIRKNPKESRKNWMIWMFERAGKKNKRNSGLQFWQQHNHPIELSTYEMMIQRLDYIHNNPVEAGFVDDPTTWQMSSCKFYEKGIEDKIKISPIN